MKSLLVHLDASPRSAVRLALAQRLARRHRAELTALYAVESALLAAPLSAVEGLGVAAEVLADLDRVQRERARAVFDQAGGDAAMRWVDAGDAPYPALLRHALTSDLLVLGQHDADDTLTGELPPELVPALIVDSGKPALVIPCVGNLAGVMGADNAGSFDAVPRDVLVAWKPTREAARAVAAAMPWLRQAARVHVAIQPEFDDGLVALDPALERWLQVHDVAAPVLCHRLGPGDAGEGLLSLAADIGAGLLVMGCYGHARAREWVLGGASRSVLRAMTLPVLMVH